MPGACRFVKSVTPGKALTSFCSSSHATTQVAPIRPHQAWHLVDLTLARPLVMLAIPNPPGLAPWQLGAVPARSCVGAVRLVAYLDIGLVAWPATAAIFEMAAALDRTAAAGVAYDLRTDRRM